ncbi:MAG: hypothetical protein PHI68_03090 [Candidatus Cloacimonetes bacterium]|nr:hypothetical protein [Candidatus Cloacimonadota bacterium]
MKNQYGAELIIVILLPVIISMVGGMFITGGFGQFSAFNPDMFFSWLHVYLVASLLVTMMALVTNYWKTKYGVYAVQVLTILFALVADLTLGRDVGLIHYLVPMFVLNGFSWLLLRYVFFNTYLLRFRTLVMGLSLALVLTISYRVLYLLLGKAVETGFWLSYYTLFLYLSIFICFGLSFADLLVIKIYIKRLKQNPPDEEPEPEEPGDDEDLDAQR